VKHCTKPLKIPSKYGSIFHVYTNFERNYSNSRLSIEKIIWNLLSIIENNSPVISFSYHIWINYSGNSLSFTNLTVHLWILIIVHNESRFMIDGCRNHHQNGFLHWWSPSIYYTDQLLPIWKLLPDASISPDRHPSKLDFNKLRKIRGRFLWCYVYSNYWRWREMCQEMGDIYYIINKIIDMEYSCL
jgi:hypothetical protein